MFKCQRRGARFRGDALAYGIGGLLFGQQPGFGLRAQARLLVRARVFSHGSKFFGSGALAGGTCGSRLCLDACVNGGVFGANRRARLLLHPGQRGAAARQFGLFGGALARPAFLQLQDGLRGAHCLRALRFTFHCALRGLFGGMFGCNACFQRQGGLLLRLDAFARGLDRPLFECGAALQFRNGLRHDCLPRPVCLRCFDVGQCLARVCRRIGFGAA